ncbi:MAG: adenosylcobinamide-phosphate synthase CbiB [Leptospirillia bacterium]
MAFPDSEYIPAAVVALAVVLDLLWGDPPRWPHPVRLMGFFITLYERGARAISERPGFLRGAGVVLAVGLPLASFVVAAGLIRMGTVWHPWVGFLIAVYLAYTALALTGLSRAVSQVGVCLAAGDLAAARDAVAHVVGRDPQALDAGQVAGAAVESAAENASDGVVAPLFYLALGGPALALAYKAVNTADSMVGYRGERYADFGWAAARLDDLANWIPARITWLLMTVCAGGLGYSARGAWRTALTDARRHASPNAGWPEAAVAGALGVRLGGPAHYRGQLHQRPLLGGDGALPEAIHVPRAVRLLRATGVVSAILAVAWAAA